MTWKPHYASQMPYALVVYIEISIARSHTSHKLLRIEIFECTHYYRMERMECDVAFHAHSLMGSDVVVSLFILIVY